jgi:alkylhydroperoxidase family enzyme
MPRIQPVPFDDLPAEVQEHIQKGIARGITEGKSMSIFAHSPYVALDIVERARLNRQGRIDARLVEMLRLRSAQLNGCEPCSAARKDPSVSEADVACLIDAQHLGLSRRDTLAVELLERMAIDHHSITDATVLELADEFDTEEIVELLYRCGQMIGNHRFVHVLDVLGDGEPVLEYSPETVRESWERAGHAIALPASL